MRPGYLQGYGEDTTRPGNFGIAKLDDDAIYFLNSQPPLPPEFETGYLPEHLRYSHLRTRPGYPDDQGYVHGPFVHGPFARPRDPMTFNVLMT